MLDFCTEREASFEEAELKAKIQERETELVGLNKELQQRRQTIPTWIGQRLEEHSATVASDATSTDEQPAAPQTTVLARTTDALHRCSSVSANAFSAAADVTSVLKHAHEVTQQLASVQSVALGGGLTEIDRAITAASEKENAASSADVAASVLKRRMEVQQEQAKGEKSARLK